MENIQGHFYMELKFEEVCNWIWELGIQEVTFYAFSIENFKRSPKEVNYFMNRMVSILERLTMLR